MTLKTIALTFALLLSSALSANEVFNCITQGVGTPIKITVISDENIQDIGARSNLVAQGMLRTEFQLETTDSQTGSGQFVLEFTTTAKGLNDDGSFVDLSIPGRLTLEVDEQTGELLGAGELRLENTLRTLSPRLKEFYGLSQCSGSLPAL